MSYIWTPPTQVNSASKVKRNKVAIGGQRSRIGAGITIVGASILLGLVAGQQGRAPYGAGALACLLAILIAAFLFAGNQFQVFAGWAAFEAIAYAFLRYPLYHDVATFDRFMILGLGASLFFTSWRPMAKASKKTAWTFAIFVLLYGVSTITTLIHPLPLAPLQRSPSPIQPALNWIQNLVLPFIVFVLAARTVSPDRWRVLAKALTFLGTSLGVLALIDFILGLNLSSYAGYKPFLVPGVTGIVRATGPYASPSAYGAVMVVCIAATLYLMQVEKARLWAGSAFAVEVISLAPNLTKTVWGAGLVTIIVALGVRRRITSRVILIGFTIALTLAITYSFIGNSQLLTARTTGAASAESLAARVGAWHQAILIFAHWPLFGAGAWQIINAQALVQPVYVNGIAAASSAHNTELAVLAETGLLGGIGFIALVYAMVRLVRTWRLQAETTEEVIFGSTVLAALAGYFLLSQTFGEIYDPPSPIFCALIVGALAGRLNHKASLRPTDMRPLKSSSASSPYRNGRQLSTKTVALDR